MIDWTNLFANALWILGLSTGLADLSWASWQASATRTRLREQINRPVHQAWINFAGLLFSLGLAATTDRAWELFLWLALALLFLWSTITAILPARPPKPPVL